jgi:predicted  nucleic acid-binding Zn-ribbon protein
LNKFRILCNAKDRKVFQLQNLCEEYQVKYERDMQTLQHKVDDLEERHELINTQCEELVDKNNQLHKTIKDSELRIQQLESV